MNSAVKRLSGMLALWLVCSLVHAQARGPAASAFTAASTPSAAPPVSSPFTLQGEKAPTDTPWTEPAKINLTREEGKTVGAFDGYLTWKPELLENMSKPSLCLVGKTALTFSAYLHKDTDPTSLKNDRGIEVKYSKVMDSNGFEGIAASMKEVCANPAATQDEIRNAYNAAVDMQNAPGVAIGDDWNWSWEAGIRGGKTLTANDPTSSPSTPKSYYDKTVNRETILVSGYRGFSFGLLPPLPAPGKQTAKDSAQPKVVFMNWTAGAYSDDARGGQGKSGRLSGLQANLTGSLYFLGLDTIFKIGSKSMVPSLVASAQVEKDVTSSGSRPQSTYRLYSAGLTIEVGPSGTSNGEMIPSLTLKRSTGADLLTGRANSAKTELTFGLTF